MLNRFYILLAFVYFLSGSVSAQNSGNGIFLTAEDFLNHKISYASKHTHIKLHEVFHKDIIEVKTKDSTYTFLKKDVFGYQDHEGIIYRFFDAKIYTIVNPSEEILIYKISDGVPEKGRAQTFTYYFSKDASQAVFPLTISYLEKSFSENKAYQDLIEVHFTAKSNLLEFDDTHKIYKINRLLDLTKNQKNGQ